MGRSCPLSFAAERYVFSSHDERQLARWATVRLPLQSGLIAAYRIAAKLRAELWLKSEF
jgi:hypothetical protein